MTANSSLKKYELTLKSEVFDSFRCQRAANSLDIDVNKKSEHHFSVEADIESEYSIGLILGASGSGKTTFASSVFGSECFDSIMDSEKSVIDQFPEGLSYDECAKILSGVGLTSVPCWIRPVKTLSNGQKARAEAALKMSTMKPGEVSLIDEWTSVVDRTVAKVMSHCMHKFIKKNKYKAVLLSCHYDVLEWLDPDWVIDCNRQVFIDRRQFSEEERKKKEQLQFTVREVDRSSWKFFSKYHYLSDQVPGGKCSFYGLFHGVEQIGFMCFANYVPHMKPKKIIFHSNRVVVHPDYAGFGLGLKFVNIASELFFQKMNRNCRIMATFSSVPMHKARQKQTDLWRILKISRRVGRYKNSGDIGRNKRGVDNGSYRQNVKIYNYEWIGM